MKKTHLGDKVYAMPDTKVVKVVNFIDGYLDVLKDKERAQVDASMIIRRIRDEITK